MFFLADFFAGQEIELDQHCNPTRQRGGRWLTRFTFSRSIVTRRASEGTAVNPPSLALRVAMLARQHLFSLGGTALQKLRFRRLLA
jgi:hypothetical protein